MTNLTLSAKETVILNYSLASTLAPTNSCHDKTYYGDTMVQAITAGVPITVNVNGVNRTSAIGAKLRISMGNMSSGAAWLPAVSCNGIALTMPTDQLDHGGQALRAHEVEIPVSALAESNVVQITYPASGGRMGAVSLIVSEDISPKTIYVDGASGNNADTGLSWDLAKQTVQAAVGVANPGDHIWVAEGSYSNGSVVLPSDIALYGGLAFGDASLALRSVHDHPVVFDAMPVIILDQSNVHVDSLVLTGAPDGFNNPLRIDTSQGGADVDNITIANCRMINNNSRGTTLIRGWKGQVVYDVSFDHCEFSGNSAAGDWLGVLTFSGLEGTARITHCKFFDNVIASTATGPAGGAWTLIATVTSW